MAKKAINDIADIIAKQRKLSSKDIETFITAMFRIISDGLDKDRQVKVKGLGTFKVTSVKPRESINVNTGERVVIESHDKITFTPDASMRDLVNKPFSQFETVVLNDNIDFADVEHDTPEKETASESALMEASEEKPVRLSEPSAIEQTASEDSVEHPSEEVREVSAETREDIAEGANGVAEEGNGNEKPVDKQEETPAMAGGKAEKPEVSAARAVSQTDGLSQEKVFDDEPEDSVEDAPKKRNGYIYCIIAAASVLCFIAGIYAGPFISKAVNGEKQTVKVIQKLPATDKKVVNTNKVTSQSAVKPASQAAKPIAPTAAEGLDFDKMNADVRVKYGAYKIVGVDTVITLKQGQTMTSYCRATLGSGMLCYFQVLNGADELVEGERLKVPKVKVKTSGASSN